MMMTMKIIMKMMKMFMMMIDEDDVDEDRGKYFGKINP